MKKSIVLFSVVLMMASVTNNVKAQATENTAAAAKVLVPIAISEVTPLHFGTMFRGAGGTCVLATNNTRTFTGGVTGSAVAPTSTNAAYTVAGAINTTYALTLPSTITVTETVSGSATMAISALTARFNGAGADALSGTLNSTGNDGFTVGGTLTVSGTQATGVYVGTFDVTVAYN